MVYCNHCKEKGIKIKLNYNPEDKFHPFHCSRCGNEDWYIDEITGTIKER